MEPTAARQSGARSSPSGRSGELRAVLQSQAPSSSPLGPNHVLSTLARTVDSFFKMNKRAESIVRYTVTLTLSSDET